MNSILITKFRRALRIERAVRFVWESAPNWTLANLILIFLQSIPPLIGLYVMKLIIDSVLAGITTPDKTHVFSEILMLVILAGFMALLGITLRSLASLA